MSTKGAETRQRIVQRGLELASRLGIEGLSLGELASSLELSKSGLFAHFRSKETLQIAVLELAAERFRQSVVLPALRRPRGEPRIVELFERWIAWGDDACSLDGGCIFIAASAELDDRPGPARDRLVQIQRDLQAAIAQAVRIAIDEHHFRPEVDPEQFAFELYAIVLGYAHATRLMGDSTATRRVRAAFERLLESSRVALN
jgi:AcrR family transcriptional regulator